jgi:histidinol-phosphate/aromatic aminotransferase/cobyric acid decarboxylase-like protein/GNAT superfamily N-acetyltransferase
MVEQRISPTTQVSVALARASDRKRIYAARHEVYARELRQHSENERRLLRDPLDERNEYIVAKRDGELLGFISLTSPGGQYSIDKYFDREHLALEFNSYLYEVRLLTVLPSHRGRLVTPLLMYAALRYVESHGGSQLVAIGRREVLDLYVRCGMKARGITTQAGAVQYELMTASTQEVRAAISARASQLSRIESSIQWQLPFPFRPAMHCVHGGSFWKVLGEGFRDLSRATEIVNADVLDAWFAPAPEVMAALQQNLPMLVRTAPPTHAEGMIRAISRARAVSEACVLAAPGSSALIFSAFQAWLCSKSRVLLLDPMYGEYRHVFENVIGCAVESVVGKIETGFRIDLDQVAERVTEGYDAVVLVNPNSPTGTLLPRSGLAKLFSRCEKTRFWIDETYVEFAGTENSVERLAAESANVFVCKSMSKAYALSGLRVAYMVGPGAEIAKLGKLVPPWAISLPAQVAAVAALSSSDYYNTQYRRTAELREQLAAELRNRCGIVAFPSVTNFLLCQLPAQTSDAADIVRRARTYEVFLRTGEEIHLSLGQRTIRIAVKGSEMNRKIIEVLSILYSRA